MTDFLDKLLTQISNITTTTTIGVQPIINKPAFEAMKAELESLKSQISFTD